MCNVTFAWGIVQTPTPGVIANEKSAKSCHLTSAENHFFDDLTHNAELLPEAMSKSLLF